MAILLSFQHLLLRCLRSKLGQESEIDTPVKPDNDMGQARKLHKKYLCFLS